MGMTGDQLKIKSMVICATLRTETLMASDMASISLTAGALLATK